MKTFKQFFCENNLQVADFVREFAEACNMQLIEPKNISTANTDKIYVMAERDNVLNWSYTSPVGNPGNPHNTLQLYEYMQKQNKLVLATIHGSNSRVIFRAALPLSSSFTAPTTPYVAIHGSYIDDCNIANIREEIIDTYREYDQQIQQYQNQLNTDDLSDMGGILNI